MSTATESSTFCPPTTSTTPAWGGQANARELLELVRRLARRLHRRVPSSVHVDDLISAGNEGLVQAMRSFDASRGVAFSTFARHRIMGAMLDHLQQVDTLSRTHRRRQKSVERCRRTLATRLGREPIEAEVAAELGVSIARYRRWTQQSRDLHIVSLHGRGDESSAPEPADPAPDPEEVFAASDARSRVWAAVESLPTKQRAVMQMYYMRDMTLTQVGAALGVTESRACQLKSEATSRLRGVLLQ
jgi:RNA polymerase sigma factor FliA